MTSAIVMAVLFLLVLFCHAATAKKWKFQDFYFLIFAKSRFFR